MKKFAKVAGFAVALSLAVVSTAGAQSVADLQKMIADLTAKIAAMSGSSSSASATFTRDLTVGSTGSDVTALQNWLASKGYFSGTATGYYGPVTKAAVAAYQAANGITPAAGYFGPVTRAKVNGMAGSTTTTTTSTSSLMGGEASLEDFDLTSGDDSDVEEGGEGKVLRARFDVEDADARIERVDFHVQGATGEETDPWQVFEKATLWIDGKEVASESVDSKTDWSEEGNTTPDTYRLRFSGLSSVAKEGSRVEMVLKLEVQDGVDSLPAEWDIFIPDEGVRAVDQMGIDNYTGDDSDTVSFDVVEAGQDEELTVSENSANPDSTTLSLNDDTTSEWYTILAFDLEAEENDITIKSIPVEFTVSSSTVNNVIDDYELVIDGKVVSDYTVANGTLTTASSTFDVDDEVTIKADKKVKAEVKVRFKALELGDEGITVAASVTSTNVDEIDAEGADDLTATNLKGSVTGDTHYLRTAGVIVTKVSTTASQALGLDTTATDDQGTYTVEFKVEAFDETQYVELSAFSGTNSLTADPRGASFLVETDGNSAVASSTGTTTSALSHVSGGSRTGNYVRIDEGQSATFKLTVSFDSATTGYYRVQLYSVNFADSASNPTSSPVVAPQENYETAVVEVKN
jgi:hypothetical protein